MDLASIQVGWPKAVQDDLRWLSGFAKYAISADATFEDWAAEIKGNRKGFISNVKEFSKLRYANTLIPLGGPKEGGQPSSSEQPHTFSIVTIAISKLTLVRSLQFTCSRSIKLSQYGKTTSETMCIVSFVSNTSTLGKEC